jgi:hypothetical protein
MVQAGGEAIVLQQAQPEGFKETVVYLGLVAALVANEVVVWVAYNFVFHSTAAQVGHSDHTQRAQ